MKKEYLTTDLVLYAKYLFAIDKLGLQGSLVKNGKEIKYINGYNIVTLNNESFIQNVILMKKTSYKNKSEYEKEKEDFWKKTTKREPNVKINI